MYKCNSSILMYNSIYDCIFHCDEFGFLDMHFQMKLRAMSMINFISVIFDAIVIGYIFLENNCKLIIIKLCS